MIKEDPNTCKPGEYTEASKVKTWPAMTNKGAVAFKRWTGITTVPDQKLVRQGPRIFSITGSDLALCLYNHTREF